MLKFPFIPRHMDYMASPCAAPWQAVKFTHSLLLCHFVYFIWVCITSVFSWSFIILQKFFFVQCTLSQTHLSSVSFQCHGLSTVLHRMLWQVPVKCYVRHDGLSYLNLSCRGTGIRCIYMLLLRLTQTYISYERIFISPENYTIIAFAIHYVWHYCIVSVAVTGSPQ